MTCHARRRTLLGGCTSILLPLLLLPLLQVTVWNSGGATTKLVTIACTKRAAAARGLASGDSLASASSGGEAEGTETAGMAACL